MLHFCNSSNISNFFIIIIFVLMIFNVTIVNVFGHHKWCPCKMTNFMINICILTAPPTGHSSVFRPFFVAPDSLRQNNNEIKPINYPQWPSIVHVKGRVTRLSF